MDQPTNSEAGIDDLEHLAYLIAEQMVAELNLQTGDEMLKVMKALDAAEVAQAVQAAKPKARAAGGR